MGTVRELSTDPKNVRRRFLHLCKSIDKSNKAFERADRFDKIVLVARDVLALLDMRKINACHGTYVQIDLPKASSELPKKLDDLLKLPNLPSCDVCAIGAAMVASTLRLDHVRTPKDNTEYGINAGYADPGDKYDATDDEMSRQARKAFTHVLLKEMEQAFECGAYGYGSLDRGEARLRAIYQNLIDNNGRFTRHDDKTLQVWPKRS